MDEHFELDMDNDYKGESYSGKNTKRQLFFIIFITVICLIISISLI